MNFKNLEPKNLAEWLGIATRGLAASGRERITREIEAHFAEAVEAHLAQGEPEPVAQARAIIALGDATEAAKRFQRSCLTDEERQLVSKVLAGTGKIPKLLYNLLAPAFFLGFMVFKVFWKPSLVFDAVILLLFALPIISFIISRRYGAKSKARLLIFIDLALCLLVALAITLFGVESLHEDLATFGGVVVGVIFACRPRLRILNKGRKLINDIGDTQRLAE